MGHWNFTFCRTCGVGCTADCSCYAADSCASREQVGFSQSISETRRLLAAMEVELGDGCLRLWSHSRRRCNEPESIVRWELCKSSCLAQLGLVERYHGSSSIQSRQPECHFRLSSCTDSFHRATLRSCKTWWGWHFGLIGMSFAAEVGADEADEADDEIGADSFPGRSLSIEHCDTAACWNCCSFDAKMKRWTMINHRKLSRFAAHLLALRSVSNIDLSTDECGQCNQLKVNQNWWSTRITFAQLSAPYQKHLWGLFWVFAASSTTTRMILMIWILMNGIFIRKIEIQKCCWGTQRNSQCAPNNIKIFNGTVVTMSQTISSWSIWILSNFSFFYLHASLFGHCSSAYLAICFFASCILLRSVESEKSLFGGTFIQ